MRKYYEIALRLANESLHPKHKMAALVVKGGAIVSTATNSPSWHRHAERRCLKFGVSGDLIVIARKGGSMSKPCSECLAAIQNAGIKRVVYANWNKELVVDVC